MGVTPYIWLNIPINSVDSLDFVTVVSRSRRRTKAESSAEAELSAEAEMSSKAEMSTAKAEMSTAKVEMSRPLNELLCLGISDRKFRAQQ